MVNILPYSDCMPQTYIVANFDYYRELLVLTLHSILNISRVLIATPFFLDRTYFYNLIGSLAAYKVLL